MTVRNNGTSLKIRCSMFWLALVLLSSCSTKSGADNKRLMQEAGDYITELKQAGRLPGVAKEDKGSLHVLLGPVSDSIEGEQALKKSAAFPVTFTVQASKLGDLSKRPLYCYAVTKAAQDSGWHLDRSWMIDENGRTNELK
jgi:hypothetical protein